MEWPPGWSSMGPKCTCGDGAKRCWPRLPKRLPAAGSVRCTIRPSTYGIRRPSTLPWQEIWQRHGPLTGLLNNAAANFIAPTASLSQRAFEAVTSTVMTGSFNTTVAVGKRWIAAGLPGAVLSNLTTWVWSGSAFVVPSAMAKAAVHAMTMSLAVEWGRYGIRVNALAPGPIPTEYAWEMLNPTDKSSVGATQEDQIPLGRSGTIDELGQPDHLRVLRMPATT